MCQRCSSLPLVLVLGLLATAVPAVWAPPPAARGPTRPNRGAEAATATFAADGTCSDTLHALGGAASSDPALAALLQRLCRITHRTAWHHQFLLPPHVLARAYSIKGNDSRLRTFVRKLVLGAPTRYAHLGGSISVMALAKTKDMNWHAMFHRWLELAFTPCGDLLPSLNARDPWPNYAADMHVCPQSTVTLANHAIGATSCLFAEKCIVQRVNRTATDWVMVEYTQNAIKGVAGESLDTVERRALERLLRKLLLLPSRPAVTLVHSYAVSDGPKWGDNSIQDWHDLLAQYYGNVQAISMRGAVYDLLWANSSLHKDMYMPDGLHPTWLGHLLWADIMIHTFKQLAIEVMGELLLHALVPSIHTKQQGPSPAPSQDEGAPRQLPRALADYYHAKAGRHRTLPPPAVSGNWENSDGHCHMSEDLRPLVEHSGLETQPAGRGAGKGVPEAGPQGGLPMDSQVASEIRATLDGGSVLEPTGWKWVDEGRGPGRHKWGFVSTTPGSKLVLRIDSTVGGLLQPSATTNSAPLASGNQASSSSTNIVSQGTGSQEFGAGDGGGTAPTANPEKGAVAGNDVDGEGGQRFVQTSQGLRPFNNTHAQVMLGYLSSYEGIGGARVSCISGCICDEQEVQALWQQRYSATAFLYMMVSAHKNCRIQVEVLPGASTKFKVEGVIINSRPYYWDALSTATHYEFMATDLFNNIN